MTHFHFWLSIPILRLKILHVGSAFFFPSSTHQSFLKTFILVTSLKVFRHQVRPGNLKSQIHGTNPLWSKIDKNTEKTAILSFTFP